MTVGSRMSRLWCMTSSRITLLDTVIFYEVKVKEWTRQETNFNTRLNQKERRRVTMTGRREQVHMSGNKTGDHRNRQYCVGRRVYGDWGSDLTPTILYSNE